jgi:hypothetical protein
MPCNYLLLYVKSIIWSVERAIKTAMKHERALCEWWTASQASKQCKQGSVLCYSYATGEARIYPAAASHTATGTSQLDDLACFLLDLFVAE